MQFFPRDKSISPSVKVNFKVVNGIKNANNALIILIYS